MRPAHSGRPIVLAVLALTLTGTFAAPAASPQRALDPAAGEEVERLRSAAAGRVFTRVARETGNHDFVLATDGGVLVSDDAGASPERRALSFLAAHGRAIGVRAARPATAAGEPGGRTALAAEPDATEVVVRRVMRDALGQSHVRLDQVYRGLPVFGAQLVVHMSPRGIHGVNGTFVPGIQLDTRPSVDGDAASRTATLHLAKEAGAAGLTAGPPRLLVYRTGLLEGFHGENRLAWSVEVHGATLRELVLVDALTGAVLNRISLRHEALYREIYSPVLNDATLLRKEGDPPNTVDGDPIDALYDFAGETHAFFANGFGRDSYDGAGARMKSVYLVNEQCPNAYWNGTATHYCPLFDDDDVVSHEWGHAYTEYTHGLIYSYQSGALNESYSDIWGETIDLHNGHDGPGGDNNAARYPDGQRWLIGEDVEALGPLRDMMDPTNFGNADRVGNTQYYACGAGDGGGVHSNSGVPNHGYAMIVDGQTFNGQTVQGIGFVKAAHLYFRAMATYQVPSTNFSAHADALEASCADLRLAGTDLVDPFTGAPSGQVITQGDCDQVAKAMLAVEMRSTPPCAGGLILDPDTPAACPSATTIFSEGFESGLDGWTLESLGLFPADWPGYSWFVRGELPAGRSGSAAFAPDPVDGTCAPGGDHSGKFAMTSPPIALPAGAGRFELRFDHSIETEAGWDGGNILYSTNGVVFQLVPPEAYLWNGPNMELNPTASDTPNTNPKAGEAAWSGVNQGPTEPSWGTTIVDLSALASPGQTVWIKFELGMDGCNGVTGWFVDDVRVVLCPIQPPAAPSQNAIADDATPDQVDGVDKDGRYRLSWSYPAAPVEQPCGFRVEEATSFGTLFTDDGSQPLLLGSNAKWTGAAQWSSAPHPDTATPGYTVVYLDNLDAPLAMATAVAIPAGTAARLTFASFEDIEDGYDYGFVEVSSDGGAFQTLATYTGSFSGQRAVDLTPFAGRSIKVRFRLTSDNIFAFPLHLGWFVDDIAISASNFAPIATVSGSTLQYDVIGRGNATWAYRIAGLFGSSCTSVGPTSGIQQITVELGPPTYAPTASFTASPNPANVNQQVAFNGAASQDSDAVGPAPAIVEYFWSFGDGTTQTTPGPTTSHAYSSAGTYRATLTVTDNDGETASTEALVEVHTPPPPGAREAAGGGHIAAGGGKASFGFDVESSVTGVSGDLTYHDNAGEVKVQSQSISSLTVSGKTATIKGTCTVNKVSGFTFTVDVTDNGSPGTSDTFRIRLTGGYDQGGTLSGGNIQVK